ncbi:MAG: DNA translocase FtsK 4TM domain-containing protein, partial [Clostridia bacterium]
MPQSKKAVKKATPKKSATVKNTKTAASPERKKLGLTPYVLFAAAIFICITFFIDDSGFLGKYIKLVLWGLFGTGSFFIPFYMIFTAIFWKRDHENKIAGTKYLLATLNFVFILIIIHLFSPAPQANEGVSFAENLYENGKKLIDGGVIGGSIGYGIQKLIGYVASLVLSFFLSAVTLIFFFGSTPMRVIKYIIDLFKKVELQDLQNDEKDVPEPKIQKAQKPEKSTARDAAKSCAEPRTLPDETFFSTEKDGQQKFNAPFVPQADIPGIKVDHKTGFSNEELNRDYKRIFEEDSAKKDPLKKDPLKKEPENKIIHEKDLSPKIEQVKNAFDQATPIDFSQTEILDQNPEILLTHNPIDVPENLHDDAESVNDSADLQFESETAELEFGGEPPYIFPPISLLTQGKSYYDDDNYENILETGKKLVEILESYGVKTKLISTSRGPTVTRYELQPDAGVRVAKIANLSDDIR